MNVSSVLTFARAQAQTNSVGLTDANGLVFINEALSDFHRRLVDHDVDASQLQESSILTATGVNSYPTNPSILSLKTLEVNYADTTNGNYKVADQVDVSNLLANTSFSWFRDNNDQGSPKYDDRGNSFEIFPTPKTSVVVRLFYYAQPSIYGATTDTINYPEVIDPAILGWRVAANYLYSLGQARIPDGDKFMVNYENRVNQYISTLSRGGQHPIKATPIQATGFEF